MSRIHIIVALNQALIRKLAPVFPFWGKTCRRRLMRVFASHRLYYVERQQININLPAETGGTRGVNAPVRGEARGVVVLRA